MLPILLSIISSILISIFLFFPNIRRSLLALTPLWPTWKPQSLPPSPFQEPAQQQQQQQRSQSPHPPTSTSPITPNKPTFKDGYHTFTYPNGTSYSGQWKDSLMHGRGIFLWPDGRRFEGEWRDGKQHGQGTLALPDGSIYYGGWSHGLMDGLGVYKPSPDVVDTITQSQSYKSSFETDSPPHSPTMSNTTTTINDNKSMVYLREYSKGVLLKEIPMKINRVDPERKQQIKKERKKMNARPLRPGEVIYKGHRSYDLMKQLQLGIMYSIAQASSDCSGSSTTTSHYNNNINNNKQLHNDEYTAESVQYFPPGSTADTPGFKYKDYAPAVFQRLRSLFSIDNADYLVSLTGGPALRELPSPGSSGCIFFLSEDDRFLIKSVRKEEMSLLLSLIKKYYKHVENNTDTLLVRFFGVHRVSPFLGRNARFLVMGNVLPTNIRLHRRYDLKGSTYKRTVGEERKNNDPNVTLKDLDIDMTFELSHAVHALLLTQLQRDVSFLESLHVMDYSLLLGVHFVRWGESGWYPPGSDWPVALMPPSLLSLTASVDDEQVNGGGSNIIGSSCDDGVHCSTATGNTTNNNTNTNDGDEVIQQHQSMSTNNNTNNNTTNNTTNNTIITKSRPKPTRASSILAGHSLAETLETMSSVDIEPRLSMKAASIVASANSVRHLARESAAAAAASKQNMRVVEMNSVSSRSRLYDGGGSIECMHEEHSDDEDEANDYIDDDSINNSNKTSPLPPITTSITRNTNNNHQQHHQQNQQRKTSIGWGIHATALRIHSKTGELMREPVLLYLGIIDFLQVYNTRKRLEHVWKTSLHGHSVSVADPHEYASRFMSHMNDIFVSSG